MSELIDRQATLKKMCELCGNRCEKFEKAMQTTHLCSNYRFLSEQPTIEAEPVRHGQWSEIYCYTEHGVSMADYECTNCGAEISKQRDDTPKYCEHCGAVMREEGAENGRFD